MSKHESNCRICVGSDMYPDHAGIYRHGSNQSGAPLYCKSCVEREMHGLTGTLSDIEGGGQQ